MATVKNPEVKTKNLKPRAALNDRIKKLLNQSALSGKLTLDELSDIEQHVKRVATLLGAP